ACRRGTAASRNPTWECARVLPFFEQHLAVDNRPLDALSQLLSAGGSARQVGGLLRLERRDRARVEHYEVGRHAGPHHSAVVQTEQGGRDERELLNRVLEGHNSF